MDSIKISREEGIELPFTKHDVVKTIDSFVPAKYRQQFNFKGSKITFFDAGHIPGSSMPLISSGGKNILYTGDFKTADSRLLKGADSDLPDIDVLITESTYGYRDHPDRKSQEKLLIETIKNTLAVNGVCLIAGFAVGRLDEILLVLDSYGIDYPLYIDGMAKKAITIINRHKSLMKEPNALDKALKKAEYITEEKQWKKIIRQPCVILTTSGMLSGGPIVGYIKKLYDNRDCSLVLSGFQCVTEDTNVYLNHEHDEIKSLFKQSDKFLKNNNLEIRKLNEKIASFNINKRCFDIGRIAFTARRRHDGEVIKLTLESGKELLLSPEHPVLTKDMKYKKAGNLTIEDEIIGV